MTTAYDELYLGRARITLGSMLHFAVYDLERDISAFFENFISSGLSYRFGRGEPKVTVGISGAELANEVIYRTTGRECEVKPSPIYDKSPEYWAGWALAFYQWYTSRSFFELLSAVPFSELIKMYPVYHEMDIEQFIDHMDKLIQNAYPSTRLRAKRINNGMSQSELARDSGVALRQIQLFEQRQRDINNASAITLLKLSRSLHCRIEDLIEL